MPERLSSTYLISLNKTHMIKQIESADNSRLRLVRKLGAKKHRDTEGLFVIEGINLVTEAIGRGEDLRFVIVSEDRRDILNVISDRANGIEVCSVDRQLFEKTADAENGSGVIAVVAKREYDIVKLSAIVAPEDNILILDRLQDPGNIGTIIRTAVATGYRAVFAVRGTADIYSPKVLRATAGMIFDMPTIYFESASDMIDAVRRLNKKFAVTHPSEGIEYYKTDISKGIGLVIGNEGNGVSDEVLKEADIKITIPMKGKVESLNAAVSAAILMYESIR